MSSSLSLEEQLVRFLFIGNQDGIYITGNPEPHLGYINKCRLIIIFWNKADQKATVQDFVKTIERVNESKHLVRRENIFFMLAHALALNLFKPEEKQVIKESVLKCVKSDKEFFDFVKYYTNLRKDDKKQKISTTLRKLIIKFYKNKTPKQMLECITKQESYHGWTHKDLIKLCHYKPENISTIPIIKYALFGIKALPNPDNEEDKEIVDILNESHELRTTEDVSRAVALISELHATPERVNSKLNKKEEIWAAALPELTTRYILQNLYKFFKLGFLKPNTHIQSKIIEALTNADNIKKCELHPVEVYIYLRCFEKGGKALDQKLLDYLNSKKELKEETLKKLTTPIEPKCQAIVQAVNKCLMLSYSNVASTGKKFLITIDNLEKADTPCYRNKRISCLEAAYALIRYMMKVEKNVTVAIFKENTIQIIDLSKSYSSQKAIEKLQENQPSYILPGAPLEWAANKKKYFDVFINFLRTDWQENVPTDVKDKADAPAQNLTNYCKRMKAPNTKLVRFVLSNIKGVYCEGFKNILTIVGLSSEVPRVLEAFVNGSFY